MTDSMNLDSSDIGTLDDFDSLQTIQAELDILNEQVHDNGKVVIAPAHMEIIPSILPKEELNIKNEGSEQMEEDDLEEEMITDNMMEDAISNEMMHDVMEMQEDEHELQPEHIDTINNVIRHDNHSLFSEGVIEEIIEDEQVIKEEPPVIYENIEHISQEQILEEKTEYVDDIMDNNVVTEETIIESGEVEDKTLEKEMEVPEIKELPIKQEIQPETQLKQIRIQQIQQPVVVSSVSTSSLSVPSGVYVVSTTKGQSLLQGNAIFTTKDASKMTRVLTLPTSIDGSATMSGGQTIRIVAPQGKVLGGLGGVGKAFTIEQARKLGLISQSSINQILPNAKTVTVMKSPAKILPAPPPNMQNKGGNQKVLIRHANTLKPGTILTTSSPGSQVIRLPSNQAIATHLQLPGGTKQVQYVKLIGGTGNKTLLPVSLSKTIPVAALSTSLLNTGQTTYKVVPISTPQTATTVNAAPQRVLIPANTVQTTSAQAQNMNNVLMIQSNLVQVKKISPKEDPKPQATQAATPLSPDSANANVVNNVSLKEPKTEYLSGDEIIEANGIRPRKPCNCTKSMCLKLYCDCFANGEFCNMCNCTTCYNNLEHEEERQAAIKSCLERNPAAFRPKIGKTFIGSEERRHNKGCNCRRSGCLKNYCECYEAKIPCSKNCKCIGCKNLESYINKRGPTAEERLRAKDAINQIKSEYDQHSGGQSKIFKQAFNLMTNEVIQATCQCLIAQAEEWNTATVDQAQAEIIEEFGRCIVQIIDTVAKSLGTQQPLPSNS